MKRSTFRLIIILGVFCITGIIMVQSYWVRKAFDLKEKQFQQNIHTALQNVAEKMASFSGVAIPAESPVQQLQSDYYVVNVNSSIDASVLEHYLKSEFFRLNLFVDYEYQIYDCNSNQMVYGKYIRSSPSSAASTKLSSLPRWDQYTYYFGIRFPGRESYLLESMDIWLFSSFVLITVVLFFGYALTAISKQKRLSELQKDFVNNMTHEFKTPLSTIAIAANVLSKPGIEEDVQSLKTYAGIIATENKRLVSQIEKVLQIASLEKEEIKLTRQRIDMHQLLQHITYSAGLNLSADKGTINLHLNASHPTVVADELHLTNVLFNLIDNAVKYSKEIPDIRITTRDSSDTLLIDIQDQGIGISKQYQQKIFEKFFRVPTGNVHNVKGFGLGLSYVQKIVVAHHWKIELNSMENLGSTFTLHIPISQ